MTAILILAVLITLNGLFALSELAVVSARRSRLEAMAAKGQAGARAALALARSPGRFLSTVQVGITLVAILTGAVSGAALGDRFDALLEAWGLPTALAEPLAYAAVLAAITYASVVIGELIPKNLALRNPERFACALAPLMTLMSRIAAPVVWLLDASTQGIFRLFGQSTAPETAITEEEIKTLLAEAAKTGVIEVEERAMIAGILRLGDRKVSGLMTPRTLVDVIDLSDEHEKTLAKILESPHAQLPVCEGYPDNIIGVVHVRDVLSALVAGGGFDLRAFVRPAPVIPDTVDALDALERLREAEIPIVLVHDEYGHFEGIVTPADALDAIAGAFKGLDIVADPEAVQRQDGSWLLAGSMPADEMADVIGIALPSSRDFHTVAGFVIWLLERLPATGESVDMEGWRFEVVDMDAHRVDKVLARRLTGAEGEALPAEA